MDRMKTFLIYVLLIIGFFIVSIFLENVLLKAMYYNISGNLSGDYSETDGDFTIENMSANASKTNGYIDFDLVNTTGEYIDKCYVKVDLYNEQGLLADTEYIEVSDFKPNERRSFHIKFKANNIKDYRISFVKEMPDKSNIIDIFGWELDLTDLFGLGIDLTNLKILGIPVKDLFDLDKLKDILSWNNIKNKGNNAFNKFFGNADWGTWFVIWWFFFSPMGL